MITRPKDIREFAEQLVEMLELDKSPDRAHYTEIIQHSLGAYGGLVRDETIYDELKKQMQQLTPQRNMPKKDALYFINQMADLCGFDKMDRHSLLPMVRIMAAYEQFLLEKHGIQDDAKPKRK